MARPREAPYPRLRDVLETLDFLDGEAKLGEVWRACHARLGNEEISYNGTRVRLAELVEAGNVELDGLRNQARYRLLSLRLDDPDAVTKTCCDCGFAKPLGEFSGRGSRPGDRRRRCRSCERSASRVATGYVCEAPECEEHVLRPGLCGFCREEGGSERLTTPTGLDPRTPAENRRDIALAAAGGISANVAANLG